MFFRKWFFLPLLLFLFAGCSSLRVQSDFNPDYDFSKLKKAAVLYPKSEDDTVTLAQQRFARAIAEELRKKGFTVVTEKTDADFYIVFHLNVTEKRQVVTDYQLVGVYPYRPYYFGYGVAIPVEREYTWTEGRFIIDAVDPHGNEIFWRGIATDRLHEFKTPEERMAYIRSVVAEVLKNFPPHTSQPQGEK